MDPRVVRSPILKYFTCSFILLHQSLPLIFSFSLHSFALRESFSFANFSLPFLSSSSVHLFEKPLLKVTGIFMVDFVMLVMFWCVENFTQENFTHGNFHPGNFHPQMINDNNAYNRLKKKYIYIFFYFPGHQNGPKVKNW